MERLEDLFIAIFENRVSVFLENPAEFKMVMQEILLRPELAAPFREKYHCRIEPLLNQAFERFRERGELSDAPWATMRRMMSSVLLGYGIQRLVLRPDLDWDDASEIRAMASLLADGMRPRAPQKVEKTRKSPTKKKTVRASKKKTARARSS